MYHNLIFSNLKKSIERKSKFFSTLCFWRVLDSSNTLMFMRFIPLLRPTHRSYINKSYAFTEWNKIRFRKKIRNNYIHRFSIFHYKRTPFSFGSFLSTFVVFSSQVFIWNCKAVFFVVCNSLCDCLLVPERCQ